MNHTLQEAKHRRMWYSNFELRVGSGAMTLNESTLKHVHVHMTC